MLIPRVQQHLLISSHLQHVHHYPQIHEKTLPLHLRGGNGSPASVWAVRIVGLLLLAVLPVVVSIFMQHFTIGRTPAMPLLDPETWRQVRIEYSKGVADAAQQEAAEKLMSNHAAVLRDLTNPAPKSQIELPRLPIAVGDFVDRALAEVVRRLGGGRSEPASDKEAKVWAETAQLLSARLQSTCDDMRHHPHFKNRAPDMSVAAVASMRKVLEEMASPLVPPNA